jgi:L-lysine 2,3-aminomutase
VEPIVVVRIADRPPAVQPMAIFYEGAK